MHALTSPDQRHRIALDKAARSVREAVGRDQALKQKRHRKLVDRLLRRPVPTQNRVKVDSFADVLFYASHGYRWDQSVSGSSMYMVRTL